MTRSTRILATGCMIALGLAFPLLLAEGVLRLSGSVPVVPQMFELDPELGHRLKAGVHERARARGIYDYRWTVTEQGFRGQQVFSAVRPAGVRRLLALGDSFTFGIGVNDHETWPAQLDSILSRTCEANPVEVVNAGVGGYGTSHALSVLERTRRSLRPDLIVYGFFVNDPSDDRSHGVYALAGDTLASREPPSADVSRAKRLASSIPGYTWLVRHSALVNWLRLQYFAVRNRNAAPAATPETLTGQPTPPWELTERLLGRMREVARQDGADLLVLLIPDSVSHRRWVAGDTTVAGEGSIIIGGMLDRCAALGIECVDLRAAMHRVEPDADPRSLYIANEGHFTAEGHRLAALVAASRVAPRLGCTVPVTPSSIAGAARGLQLGGGTP